VLRSREGRPRIKGQGARQRAPKTAKILTGYGTEKEESKTSNRELNRKRGRRKKIATGCRAKRERT